MNGQRVNIGIIGLGTVGVGVARILLQQGDLLKTRSTLTFHLKTIAELDWNKDRNLDLSNVNVPIMHTMYWMTRRLTLLLRQ